MDLRTPLEQVIAYAHDLEQEIADLKRELMVVAKELANLYDNLDESDEWTW